MPYCYGSGGGYGRFLERRPQPVVEPSKFESLPLVAMRNDMRPVVCVETGVVYGSVSEAAKAVIRHGQATRTIRQKITSAVCTGERANGFRWREVPA